MGGGGGGGGGAPHPPRTPPGVSFSATWLLWIQRSHRGGGFQDQVQHFINRHLNSAIRHTNFDYLISSRGQRGGALDAGVWFPEADEHLIFVKPAAASRQLGARARGHLPQQPDRQLIFVLLRKTKIIKESNGRRRSGGADARVCGACMSRQNWS